MSAFFQIQNNSRHILEMFSYIEIGGGQSGR